MHFVYYPTAPINSFTSNSRYPISTDEDGIRCSVEHFISRTCLFLHSFGLECNQKTHIQNRITKQVQAICTVVYNIPIVSSFNDVTTLRISLFIQLSLTNIFCTYHSMCQQNILQTHNTRMPKYHVDISICLLIQVYHFLTDKAQSTKKRKDYFLQIHTGINPFIVGK